MLYLVITNIKLFFLLGFAQRSPIISYISQTQIKDIGGTVELSCSVQYTQDYAVIWMKVDRGPDGYSLPISTGSALILHDSRFSLRYDPVKFYITDKIKNTTFLYIFRLVQRIYCK